MFRITYSLLEPFTHASCSLSILIDVAKGMKSYVSFRNRMISVMLTVGSSDFSYVASGMNLLSILSQIVCQLKLSDYSVFVSILRIS